MEPFAAKTCLLSLLSYDLTISSFTTDRSSTIETMMKADPRLAKICHEYDIWHWNSKYFSAQPNQKIVVEHNVVSK